MLLACFVDQPSPTMAAPDAGSAIGPGSHPAELEADLEATRSDLSNALRDLDREVEAHGAEAAEAYSINEELQSTVEELLASKEELQSLNEELNALNGQLQETLERHRTTANDLQNVLFSTNVATIFLDLNLNIRFFTPSARAIFRVIPGDLGRPLADLAAVVRDDDLAGDAKQVLATSEPIERETSGADGTSFRRRIQPYRGEGGRVAGVVITYDDITEHTRANAALVRAMREADRATRAKSRFLASASHDLRQPLQSMALLHKLIARPRQTSEAGRLSALLDRTLKSMTSMLDSMLDVHRIESGIIRPDMRSVAIAPLLQRLVEEFKPQCGLKGLSIRWVSCKAWVRTDPQLLEQMLRNLLSNALKYTSSGGILVGCRRRGASITILVCDSGIGVPESETSAIFEAYHQVAKAPALMGQGLGLGLSIVQRLATLMDHPVSVRSTPGKGSAFMITVPVVDADDGVPAAAEVTPVLPAAARPTGTILLVEKEEPLRDLLKEVLTEEGHKVMAFANAEDALAWASGGEARPDVLLTDLGLREGESGLTLAQDLSDVFGQTLPTIVLTGDTTSATLKTLAASDFRHVVKPVMPEVLLALIADQIQMARAAWAEANRPRDPSEIIVQVIDDDPMVLATLRRLFEAEGWMVNTHASAEAFLAAPRSAGSACLVVDNTLPGMKGVELIKVLRTRSPSLPAIMLTGQGDAALAVAAMKAGASDFIEKPASAADLVAVVRNAISAEKVGDSRPLPAQRKAAQDRLAALTGRERDILARVLAGTPSKNIAADLRINQRTVENHRAAVMRKTGAKSIPELVRLALAAETVGV